MIFQVWVAPMNRSHPFFILNLITVVMKILFLLLSIIGLETNTSPVHFTKADKRFVKNVIKVNGRKGLIEVTKRKDQHIVVEYTTTMLVLNPNGFISKVYILEDGDWLDLGPESN